MVAAFLLELVKAVDEYVRLNQVVLKELYDQVYVALHLLLLTLPQLGLVVELHGEARKVIFEIFFLHLFD